LGWAFLFLGIQANLTGKWIKRITADSVEFEDGDVVDTTSLDGKRIKPLI
jgi:hypothetical protein